MGKVGQPPYYSDPLAFDLKVQEYFEYTDREKKPATITGMALYLGFCTRQSLYEYEGREGFGPVVRRARMMIECVYEQRLHGPQVAGAIFALKNMGWTDKQVREITNPDGSLTRSPVDLANLSDEQLRQLTSIAASVAPSASKS